MNALPPLIPVTEVADRRFMPAWFGLSLTAGAVNGAALLACQRFVSHVTGSFTRFGVDYQSGRLLLDYGAVLVCFMLGAMAAYWSLDARRMARRSTSPSLPLGIVSATLLVAAVAGHLGAFGPFGQTVETTGDFVMLGLLAFAMGLQNASVALVSGMTVRTTHLTGPLTDFSIALAVSLGQGSDLTKSIARRGALLRAIKIGGFVVGAFLAALLGPSLQYLTFLLPAVTSVLSAFWLSLAMNTNESPSEPGTSRV